MQLRILMAVIGISSFSMAKAQSHAIQFEKYTLPNGLKVILHVK